MEWKDKDILTRKKNDSEEKRKTGGTLEREEIRKMGTFSSGKIKKGILGEERKRKGKNF